MAACVARFGRVDALINNAGRSAHALFEEVGDLAWYEELMKINLWGSVWCTHAALPYLKQSRGSIVAVSSLAGLVGVSVTIAYPGVVATQIRHRGYNAAGGALGSSSLKEDQAMPVEECARLIVDAMQARRREVVMSAKGKLGRWMKLIAPGLVERMALAALKDDVKPH